MIGKEKILGEDINDLSDDSILNLLVDPEIEDGLKKEIMGLYMNKIIEEEEIKEEQYLRLVEGIRKTQANSDRFKGTYDDISHFPARDVRKAINNYK
jgi:hypothetical protein